jgi:hypothetical protein
MSAGQLNGRMMATAPATPAHTQDVAKLSPLLKPKTMLVVPDAAMKMIEERYAQRAGHGDAVVGRVRWAVLVSTTAPSLPGNAVNFTPHERCGSAFVTSP